MSQNNAKFPYGKCECDADPYANISSGCCHGEGPAAYMATRDGEETRLCTRCVVSDDNATAQLLVTEADDARVYLDFDLIGAMCLMFELKKEKAKKQESAS